MPCSSIFSDIWGFIWPGFQAALVPVRECTGFAPLEINDIAKNRKNFHCRASHANSQVDIIFDHNVVSISHRPSRGRPSASPTTSSISILRRNLHRQVRRPAISPPLPVPQPNNPHRNRPRDHTRIIHLRRPRRLRERKQKNHIKSHNIRARHRIHAVTPPPHPEPSRPDIAPPTQQVRQDGRQIAERG